MARLFKVILATQTTVNVVANSPEEAQAKVQLTEGQTVASVTDEGEVTA